MSTESCLNVRIYYFRLSTSQGCSKIMLNKLDIQHYMPLWLNVRFYTFFIRYKYGVPFGLSLSFRDFEIFILKTTMRGCESTKDYEKAQNHNKKRPDHYFVFLVPYGNSLSSKKNTFYFTKIPSLAPKYEHISEIYRKSLARRFGRPHETCK